MARFTREPGRWIALSGQSLFAIHIGRDPQTNAYSGFQPVEADGMSQYIVELLNKAGGSHGFEKFMRHYMRSNPRPRRTRKRMETLRRMQFFRSHGGGVVGKAAKGALDLTRAERYARAHGWDVELHPEQERYEDVYGEKDPGGEWVTVVLKDRRGQSLGSLGFVDANDANYVRVVAAELAYEAMP